MREMSGQQGTQRISKVWIIRRQLEMLTRNSKNPCNINRISHYSFLCFWTPSSVAASPLISISAAYEHWVLFGSHIPVHTDALSHTHVQTTSSWQTSDNMQSIRSHKDLLQWGAWTNNEQFCKWPQMASLLCWQWTLTRFAITNSFFHTIALFLHLPRMGKIPRLDHMHFCFFLTQKKYTRSSTPCVEGSHLRWLK